MFIASIFPHLLIVSASMLDANPLVSTSVDHTLLCMLIVHIGAGRIEYRHHSRPQQIPEVVSNYAKPRQAS